MKVKFIPIFAITVFSCANLSAQNPEYKTHISKEFEVNPTSVLAVYNIEGHIKVEGYNGDKVLIEIDETISAKTEAILQEGKNEFKFEFEQKGDSLLAYISSPWDSRPNRNNQQWKNNKNIEYNTNLNFTIKVPKTLNLSVSTINNGDITVTGTTGLIAANNINGKITLKDIAAAKYVHTINGDVNINFLSLPPDNAKFYTLNGKMTVFLPTNFSADCDLKSFNGAFFTDFENVEKLPSKVSKISVSHDGKSTQKLSKTDVVRFGNGGKNLSFETFNGNIYIKKSSI